MGELVTFLEQRIAERNRGLAEGTVDFDGRLLADRLPEGATPAQMVEALARDPRVPWRWRFRALELLLKHGPKGVDTFQRDMGKGWDERLRDAKGRSRQAPQSSADAPNGPGPAHDTPEPDGH